MCVYHNYLIHSSRVTPYNSTIIYSVTEDVPSKLYKIQLRVVFLYFHFSTLFWFQLTLTSLP